MKLPWIALLLLGTASFCQSPPQRQIDPDKLFQMPDKFAQHAPEMRELKLQPVLWNESILAHPTIVTPPQRLNAPQIDPKIIVRPPWHSPSKGNDVAHKLYPDLKFLPLQRGPR